MAERIHVSIHVAVTTGAGVRRVALGRTGWSGHGRRVITVSYTHLTDDRDRVVAKCDCNMQDCPVATHDNDECGVLRSLLQRLYRDVFRQMCIRDSSLHSA